MSVSQIFKSTQEQAAAAWIDRLNQLRLNELLSKLASQDVNLKGALEELNKLKFSVFNEVVSRNRGGAKGMHGFIAERAQVAIENARKLIVGAKPEYFLIDNNGPVDYLRGSTEIQQKFVQNNLGLSAIKEHLEKYPQFLKNGGIYQIPKDYYDRLQEMLKISPEQAGKLRNTDYTLWKNAQEFFKQTGIDPNQIEPTVVDYSDVQQGAYEKTIDNEKSSIKEKDQGRRNEAHQQSKPTLHEGLKVTAVSAAIEGGMSLCLGVAKKLRSGKKLNEFTGQDWKEVGLDTAIGTGKGAIRGASIYGLANFTATPAAVASALVTASFGVAAQANMLRQGKITSEEFIENSEVVCLDVTISAISSVIGQALIPIPMLGAVIGNAVGMFMYGIAKDNLSKQEQALIANFNNSIQALNERLDAHYRELIEILKREFAKFKSVAELAFDLNVNIAFAGSVTLAEHVGCADEKILKDKKAVDAYFLN
ncbi:hypothetical protein AGMMS50276_06910 [Synergistales bacterium]|nr:hypothetical protein AGMMS50276_06910 [Synergistales bacterium]